MAFCFAEHAKFKHNANVVGCMRKAMEQRQSIRKTPSKFYREIRVPSGSATSAVIGRNGKTIQKFRKSQGISFVRLSSGKVEICGKSEEVVHGIALSIEALIISVIDKSEGFFPDFYIYCFCKYVAEPLSSVKKICFENFSGETFGDKKGQNSFFCFKSGVQCPEDSTSFSHEMQLKCKVNSLCTQFSHTVALSETVFSPNWDFSAYKTKLLACLKILRSDEVEATRDVKLTIRFGKQLFHGPSLRNLQDNDFLPLGDLQDLCWRKDVKSFFSTACLERAVKDLRLKLELLGYVKVSSRKKISIHVADLEDNQLSQYNISVRYDSNDGLLHSSEVRRILNAKDYFQVLDVDRGASEYELEMAYRRCLLRIQVHGINGISSDEAIKIAEEAFVFLQDPSRRDRYLKKTPVGVPSLPCNEFPSRLEEKAVIKRVRKLRKRHGFMTFCREGQAKTDFRLGVTSHETGPDNISPEMVSWVEQAWRDRTADQFLVFPLPGRFLVMNVRYKDTESYVTEDWKFRISYVGEGQRRSNMMRNKRWECGLSSRWFKWNDGITGDASIDSILKTDVHSLVKEAAKISEEMSSEI